VPQIAADQYLYISTQVLLMSILKLWQLRRYYTGVVNNATPYIYAIGQGQDTQLVTQRTILAY
jgi:hypothetical protein